MVTSNLTLQQLRDEERIAEDRYFRLKLLIGDPDLVAAARDLWREAANAVEAAEIPMRDAESSFGSVRS